MPADGLPVTVKLWHTDSGGLSDAAFLANGCHILVTTAPALLKAVTVRRWTHLERTCHLVFDQAQLTFKIHEEEVGKIMNLFRLVHSRYRGKVFPEQVVVMSSSWTVPVQQFLETFMRQDNRLGPVVAIAHFLEAAIYGNILHCCIAVLVSARF